MIFVAAVILILASVAFTLGIRAKDLPAPESVSPTQYLEERKAAIYENLRDLQFEFRVGKLSDQDYQTTKLGLQQELAVVLAEIDRVLGVPARPVSPAAPAPAAETPKPAQGAACPHCGATFPQPMKFCGECGKAMS